ncbi:MAG: hypothetical protein QXI32_02690 [Candidatus Bathyarchaeia archaeon]
MNETSLLRLFHRTFTKTVRCHRETVRAGNVTAYSLKRRLVGLKYLIRLRQNDPA